MMLPKESATFSSCRFNCFMAFLIPNSRYHFPHVATHHRNDTPYEYTTKPSHNLSGRKGSCESDIEELLSRGSDRQYRSILSAGGHRRQTLSGTRLQGLPRHHETGEKVRAGTACLRMCRVHGCATIQCQRHGGHP